MIDSLRITNFKCFEDEKFKLGNLTLLTGLNGTGKSSVIQSLLLLRQSSYRFPKPTGTLLLNGELVNLGTAKDVYREGAPVGNLTFQLDIDKISAKWEFKYDTNLEDQKEFNGQGPTSLKKGINVGPINRASLFSDDFHYLSANRLGPQATFEQSRTAINTKQLGAEGQYAPHFLLEYAEDELNLSDKRRHPSSINNRSLNAQVDAWMGEISPGIRVTPQVTFDNRINLAYQFVSPHTINQSNLYPSANVGFGITYTLPVVVALLASKKDTLVLLENPEAHLHPKGQSKLGELMARAASEGIQVIVESHSDHILNGIRIAVRDKIIEHDKVDIYYLSRPTDFVDTGPVISSSIVDPLKIEKDGGINEWPEGFFDEFEKSLIQLI